MDCEKVGDMYVWCEADGWYVGHEATGNYGPYPTRIEAINLIPSILAEYA